MKSQCETLKCRSESANRRESAGLPYAPYSNSTASARTPSRAASSSRRRARATMNRLASRSKAKRRARWRSASESSAADARTAPGAAARRVTTTSNGCTDLRVCIVGAKQAGGTASSECCASAAGCGAGFATVRETGYAIREGLRLREPIVFAELLPCLRQSHGPPPTPRWDCAAGRGAPSGGTAWCGRRRRSGRPSTCSRPPG